MEEEEEEEEEGEGGLEGGHWSRRGIMSIGGVGS